MSQDNAKITEELTKLEKALKVMQAANNPANNGHIEVLEKTIAQKRALLSSNDSTAKNPDNIEATVEAPKNTKKQKKPSTTKIPHKITDEPKKVAPKDEEAQQMRIATKKIRKEVPRKEAKGDLLTEVVKVEITRAKHDEIVKKYEQDYGDIVEGEQFTKMVNNALLANSFSTNEENIKKVAAGAPIKLIFIEDAPKVKEEQKAEQPNAQAPHEQGSQEFSQKVDGQKYSKLLAAAAPKPVEYDGAMITSQSILDQDIPKLAANGGANMRYKNTAAQVEKLTGDQSYNPSQTPATDVSREKENTRGS